MLSDTTLHTSKYSWENESVTPPSTRMTGSKLHHSLSNHPLFPRLIGLSNQIKTVRGKANKKIFIGLIIEHSTLGGSQTVTMAGVIISDKQRQTATTDVQFR